MNNAKEIVEASGKTIIKNLTKYLPLGSTAIDIYEELQTKQVGRKIQRLEEFYSALDAKILEVERPSKNLCNLYYLRKKEISIQKHISEIQTNNYFCTNGCRNEISDRHTNI